MSPFRGPCKASTALSCSCRLRSCQGMFTWTCSATQTHIHYEQNMPEDFTEISAPAECQKLKTERLLGSRWSSFRRSIGLTTSNSHQFCHCRVFLRKKRPFAGLPTVPWKSAGFMIKASAYTHGKLTEGSSMNRPIMYGQAKSKVARNMSHHFKE